MNKPAPECTDRELLIRLDERVAHIRDAMSTQTHGFSNLRKRVEWCERKIWIASGAGLVIAYVVGKAIH